MAPRSTPRGPDGLAVQRNLVTNTTSYFHYGPQGETRHLTNASGTVTDSYRFSAYGVPLYTSGSTENYHKYGAKYGYYTEGVTGIILAGARAYHPGLMRWLQRDPIGIEGGINLYEYVKGNPVKYVDPDGKAPITNESPRPVGGAGNRGLITGSGVQVQITIPPGESCGLFNPIDGVKDVDALDFNDDGIADVESNEKIPGSSFSTGWLPGSTIVGCKNGSYGPGCEIEVK